ncbi:2',5'-phosphodiesterase 12 [Acyrthosiphon pisum]|uniref:Endonuclease/exonuclease/phosphatase domain-containing protein n=1 Tax=Acyrthosiphon pisum TaxID=7029 RepID=A0A8R1VZV4_ACYPI|nr:2',5'-phosphodiesterase 12 [Acyrthosiphon pisum]|eukprot:XP_001942566.2 PREDICTED: 2',5'-phosphodiesterase 12 [Acyrthosiphon pisum]
MKYFNKLSKHIYCIKRNMSSFKLILWENSMFVNCLIPMGETKQKIMVTLPSPFNKLKTINMCRSPEDTIQVFVDRLVLKLSQSQRKVSEQEKLNTCWVFLLANGIKVPPTSKCYEIFEKIKENITLQIKDQTYKIIVNAPLIKEFKLGYPPYQGLMIYPYALDQGFNVSVMDTQYLWYRINSKDETEVGNKMTYTPTAEDVNCRLKLVCIPFNDEGQPGPKAEITSSAVLKNTIQLYPFEKRLKTKPLNSIRVVTYNLLAGEYTKTKEAKTVMYPYCPEKILASSYRHPLILRELQTYNGDIICLQEVDKHFFHRELCPILKKFKGMNGLFFKKNGRRNEGLSCFYSPEKFNLLEQFDISLNNPTTVELYCGPIVKDIMDDEIWKQGLEKKTVFQVLAFELISDKKQLFLVCNTHLISDPDGDFIRLFQALIELIIINKIKQNINKDYLGRNVSVIFCGDFNSTPESGVYDLATKLTLPEEHRTVKILNDLKNNLEFKMESAYNTDVLYSNYTKTFSGLLDYIYFTNQHLELIQVLSMPSHDDVIQHGGIPSLLFPSDHLALIADLKTK